MDAYVVAIAGDGDEVERRRPLLAPTNEIHPYPEPPLPPQPPGTDAKPEQQKPQRVASLDVFRGLTVAMMILVDDAGGAWPGINHAPWFGVTVADFVMPAFLFIIGVSAALVFKKTPNKIATSKKAAYRAIKLFILGIILQGGYIHGRHNLTYGVDLDHIRWLGVLQIHCDVRGSLGPPCNAVGFVDRFLLGENHLYKNPVYKRTKECSLNSPDYGPLPPNAPDWCLAPFDPEGLLSTLMAAVSCFVGLHFGHVLIHCKNHSQRMMSWLVASTVLTVSGFLLQLLGVPFSKPLYTVSYMLLSGGVSGFLLLVLYYVVDVMHIKKPLVLFQWMGMNALIVYVLAACELFPTLIQGFYWQSPENNLVDATESLLQIIFHSERWGTLAFVLVEIIFWCLAACFLHMKGIYLKL
ncbi:heparan-alpha-glucosaminide N-acetyltransferase-like isoform X2 [Lolium rigidum]|uniref:heparan-alpha-glucosaminide N-acetyltransferase-like isoform X2 n=1 Tax=Lolium rigidum TaxID=89674 RepID=UPI001F5DE28F|nr:heparan-alpha-glucosaminide N-acetyltransferase-like isoform X2 [Lolium rigidum]